MTWTIWPPFRDSSVEQVVAGVSFWALELSIEGFLGPWAEAVSGLLPTLWSGWTACSKTLCQGMRTTFRRESRVTTAYYLPQAASVGPKSYHFGPPLIAWPSDLFVPRVVTRAFISFYIQMISRLHTCKAWFWVSLTLKSCCNFSHFLSVSTHFSCTSVFSRKMVVSFDRSSSTLRYQWIICTCLFCSAWIYKCLIYMTPRPSFISCWASGVWFGPIKDLDTC